MFSKSLVASLVFTTTILAAPVELMTRQSCSTVQLVHAAGTTESGLGLVGAPLARSLTSVIPGATSYAVPYSTVAEYFTTVQAGATMTAKYLAEQSARCPDQKFVLSGYSKGAMVMHSTQLDDKIKSKVISVLVFGDPQRRQTTASWPISSPSVNSAPRSGNTGTQNVASFCNSGDMFCSPPGSIMPHLAYATDGSIDAAAKFAAAKAQ
ncbi:unnamed protein product [Rhizoctonia solani]|uniref:Cutinase n=1 Tax=Rhizoctonia solani TaxID=456999 RepID=A0A8H2XSU9_9AGAM|nr:unnamed protein product [Rhizoctonia solani]